jgi:hypothetical protein
MFLYGGVFSKNAKILILHANYALFQQSAVFIPPSQCHIELNKFPMFTFHFVFTLYSFHMERLNLKKLNKAGGTQQYHVEI